MAKVYCAVGLNARRSLHLVADYVGFDEYSDHVSYTSCMVIASTGDNVLQPAWVHSLSFIGLVHLVASSPKWEFGGWSWADLAENCAVGRRSETARQTSACKPNDVGRHYTDGSEAEVYDTARS